MGRGEEGEGEREKECVKDPEVKRRLYVKEKGDVKCERQRV